MSRSATIRSATGRGATSCSPIGRGAMQPADGRGGEAGSATVVGVGAVLAVLAAFVAAYHLGAAASTRHRAEAAADLAALAAAAHAVAGTPLACAQAERVTRRMAVRLTSCELTGWDAVVEVEARPPGPIAGFGTARAAARAGPTGRDVP